MVAANLVVEDELSESVVRRLLAESKQEYFVRAVYSRGGFGHIKKNIARYNAASRHSPFIVMTDLDTYNCAPELIADWLEDPMEHNLLFRVAVHEPEAWVLADAVSCAKLLGIRITEIPQNPETIADPKLSLLNLASRSRHRGIRDGLVRSDYGNFSQGGDYNGILTQHIFKNWSPSKAQAVCPSLKRMRQRLDTFVPR